MSLLAVCDAKYCFAIFDAGQYGSNNDRGLLFNSKTDKKLAQGSRNISSGATLNGCTLNPLFYFFFRINTPLVQCDIMQY